jgi:excisionase family DNA binding protein
MAYLTVGQIFGHGYRGIEIGPRCVAKQNGKLVKILGNSRDLMSENTSTRWLDIPSAARYLSASVKFIRCLIWNGEIQHIRAGKKFIVDVRELDSWAERQKVRYGRS